jgi:cytochrome c oxidase accessory protein FixG
VSALMFFDFAYFREQACILACPYGRLQAVLLDRQSLIVGYDATRGEPRGKVTKHLPVIGEAKVGDCVDCNACVATCPTGIDIRDGLQMECIGCAQCIDACDAVMAKLGRAPNLVGYTSKDRLEGKPGRLLRARTIIYPALLAITTTLLVWSASSRPETEVWIVRAQGATFVSLPDHHVGAQIRVKLENETPNTQHYRFALADAPDAELRAEQAIEIKSRRSLELTMFADMPRAAFHAGRRVVHLRVTSDRGFDKTIAVTLLGPVEGTPE